MNLTLLIDRWRKKQQQCSAEQAPIYDDCIRDLQMMATGELRPAYSLDTVFAFGKHKGERVKEVIENDANYFDWLHENVHWFQLDEAAHKYLIEVQSGVNKPEAKTSADKGYTTPKRYTPSRNY